MPKHNNFYNEKLFTEEVSRKNKAILKDYQLEMKSNHKSEKTIYQYSADIKMFLCWNYLFNDDKYLLDLKKRDFRNFFLQMADVKSSPARINRVQCSLRNMLEFCCDDEDEYDYPINAMRKIKGLQKEEVREILFLTDEQITMMIDYLLQKEDYQKALYLSLSYDSAGRRNEVHQVLKEGFLESKQTNKVVGKRGKEFKLLYFGRTKEIAKLYFEQRGEDNNPSLWNIVHDGKSEAVSYDTLYSWCMSFRKILEDLTGEYLEFTPHSFRHSSLTNYNNGTHHVLKELGKTELPLKVLKTLAHHEDISTTEGYLPNKDEELLAEAFGL